jgi:ribonuclease E
VEEQLAGMTEPQVRLPSGGYLVIHPTEALISIDVNSGRSTTERNVEETAIKTNMEAAAEVGRQLRLRDLAGLIVIDFIDMGYGKNRKHVERAMKDALKADRAKIQVGRISTFGLMELSRQRLRPSISESMGVMCPHCRGTGYIHSVETVGIQIIRTLEKEAATGEYTALRVTTHPDAALYLLNEKRAALQALEQRYNVTVAVLMDASIITGQHRLVKVTADGKEIAHENNKGAQQQRGGSRGGARRGRRGGRDGQSSGGMNFDNAITRTENDALDEQYVPSPDDDEIIGGGSAPSEGNVEFAPREPREPREPRRDRGERGGRDRNRNRNRGDRPDRTPRDPQQVADAANGEAVAPAPVELDENGQPRPARDANRRRGRRGGRNRARGDRPRREEGSIGNPVTAGSSSEPQGEQQPAAARTYKPREPSRSSHEPVSYSAPQPDAPKPSFVIPLSEKQTNPTAIASPIVSQSSGGDGSAKKKGWWSRVLES